MNVVLPKSSHPRARAARYRQHLQGAWGRAGTLLIGLLVLTIAVAMVLDVADGAVLILAALLLLALQFGLWRKLHLQQLPPSEGVADTLDVNERAEADLLAASLEAGNPRQLWQALLENWQLRFLCHRLAFDPASFTDAVPDTSQDMPEFWKDAQRLATAVGARGISSGAAAAALLLRIPNVEPWLQQNQLQVSDVRRVLHWQQRTARIMDNLQHKPLFGGIGRDWAAGYTPMLNRFGHDISGDVQHGVFRHLYIQTHPQLIEQMATQLSRPRGASVALIGKTGSGKTSLVYSLAETLLSGHGHGLEYYKIFSVDASALVAEANRSGNLEALMVRLVNEASRAGNVILFFDDAQSFFTQAAGASDMTNIMLQILQSNAVKTVFSLQPSDWQYLTSTAPDITAHLEAMHVEEPPQELTEQVMQDQCLAIEGETSSLITYRAVREAYQLAARYTLEQAFPGKGIALLKSATAHASGGLVTAEAVQQAVESMTGVKVATAQAEERDVLLNLEEQIHERMVNQSFAVRAVADALRRARAGVRSQDRPIGSFLFLGPTGVGKTELSKALAATYFDGEDRIIRLDMSEYNQAASTERLLAPAANPGTFLTQVRMQPFSVVLLDEIEKASDEVMNLLLQMLDEGMLTDLDGNQISFRDAIVITTSNAGADIIRTNIESGQQLEEFSEAFVDQLINQQYFKPELINRFDEVVLFRPLDKQELLQVLNLLVDGINRTLADKQVRISLTPEAAQSLVEQGYDPRLGARPMRRVVQRTVENVVAKRMLAGSLNPGDEAVLDIGDLEADS